MPEMDGLEAAWRIRQIEASAVERDGWRSSSDEKNSCSSAAGSENLACSKMQHSQAVPIWAVSACSDQEQFQSPVLSYIAVNRESGKQLIVYC